MYYTVAAPASFFFWGGRRGGAGQDNFQRDISVKIVREVRKKLPFIC